MEQLVSEFLRASSTPLFPSSLLSPETLTFPLLVKGQGARIQQACLSDAPVKTAKEVYFPLPCSCPCPSVATLLTSPHSCPILPSLLLCALLFQPCDFC